MKTAEIIAIGNEVVSGHTVNTNGSYIARVIQSIGILPKYHTCICDDAIEIDRELTCAENRVDFIIIIGGLGPTKDDLSKESVCRHLGLQMFTDEHQLEILKQFFVSRGKAMPGINKKQAIFPKEAYILKNDHGTAPGCIIEKDNKSYILLPGPPAELKPMFEKYALPYLKRKQESFIETLDIKVKGIGESQLAEMLNEFLGEFSWGSVATYIDNYGVIIRIKSYGATLDEARENMKRVQEPIESCLGPYIFGYNEERLEDLVVSQLINKGYKVATTESCTGGLVAAAIVSPGGASGCFDEGIITYNNSAKERYLGVSSETLMQYGAVSHQTAQEMAEGIRKAANATIGLSTTGIAGPTGGTEEKPVGLVYIGIAMPDNTCVYELHLSGSRTEVREKTVQELLFRLYKLLA